MLTFTIYKCCNLHVLGNIQSIDSTVEPIDITSAVFTVLVYYNSQILTSDMWSVYHVIPHMVWVSISNTKTILEMKQVISMNLIQISSILLNSIGI